MYSTMGLAAIPWYTLGPWHLTDKLAIQGFGLMVAIGVVLAYQLVGWRSQRFGLSADTGQGLTLYMLICGFLGAHFFDVLFYYPDQFFEKFMQFGSNLSSYGGILGAIIGMAIWKWRHKQDMLPYLDIAAFSLPIGWFFGRVGCGVVHDHPGAPTNFDLAVIFPWDRIPCKVAEGFFTGGQTCGGLRRAFANAPESERLSMATELIDVQRLESMGLTAADVLHPDGIALYDLGVYEAMWWLVIITTFFIIGKATGSLLQRRPGFFLALLPILYAPVRFSLDFLRLDDARYFGLTPGQYASMAAFTFGIVLMTMWKRGKLVEMPEYDPSAQPEPEPEKKTGSATQKSKNKQGKPKKKK